MLDKTQRKNPVAKSAPRKLFVVWGYGLLFEVGRPETEKKKKTWGKWDPENEKRQKEFSQEQRILA
jgi:hypothetical protein